MLDGFGADDRPDRSDAVRNNTRNDCPARRRFQSHGPGNRKRSDSPHAYRSDGHVDAAQCMADKHNAQII